jgi:hypothetical protein
MFEPPGIYTVSGAPDDDGRCAGGIAGGAVCAEMTCPPVGAHGTFVLRQSSLSLQRARLEGTKRGGDSKTFERRLQLADVVRGERVGYAAPATFPVDRNERHLDANRALAVVRVQRLQERFECRDFGTLLRQQPPGRSGQLDDSRVQPFLLALAQSVDSQLRNLNLALDGRQRLASGFAHVACFGMFRLKLGARLAV